MKARTELAQIVAHPVDLMKTYADFIADLCTRPTLMDALVEAVPFSDTTALRAWFEQNGYTLSGEDAELLFRNQTSLVDAEQQVKY